MSQIHVDPDDILKFVKKLNKFRKQLSHILEQLDYDFNKLSYFWKDKEYDKFIQVYTKTIKYLYYFLEILEQQKKRLIEKAEILKSEHMIFESKSLNHINNIGIDNFTPTINSNTKTKQQLDAIYTKAEGAKVEIDELADRIAKKTDGRVAKAPLKSRDRALEKAIQDYGGDATKVKDIARNTIVVEQNQYEYAISLLRNKGAKIKTHNAKTHPMGYSGTNAVIKTQNGIPAEIQVNTPEMIYAKEKPEIAKCIIGEKKYVELCTKIGIPGGRGHALYEVYRRLHVDDPQAAKIAAESCEYYNNIRHKIN